MYERHGKGRHNRKGKRLAQGGVVLGAVLLGGCSSVPDYANPVHWYESTADWISGTTEDAKPLSEPVERPRGRSAQATNDLVDGLGADRANARYNQERPNRDGTPTRPLAPQAAPSPVSAVTPKPQTVAPAAPAPVQQQVAMPQPAPAPVTTAPIAQLGDAAPPPPTVQTEVAPPPAVAAQPQPVAVRAAPAQPESLEQVYSRRLAEFSRPTAPLQPVAAATVAPPAPSLVPPPAAPVLRTASAGTITLIPPGEARKRVSASGARPLDAFPAGRSSASFRVASVAFGEGTAALAATERASLANVAALLKQGNAKARIIGYSASTRLDVDPSANLEGNRQLAAERADTVAEQLVRLGVSKQRLYAGGRVDASASATDAVEIYIDY